MPRHASINLLYSLKLARYPVSFLCPFCISLAPVALCRFALTMRCALTARPLPADYLLHFTLILLFRFLSSIARVLPLACPVVVDFEPLSVQPHSISLALLLPLLSVKSAFRWASEILHSSTRARLLVASSGRMDETRTAEVRIRVRTAIVGHSSRAWPRPPTSRRRKPGRERL
jgi:hypothetical protein